MANKVQIIISAKDMASTTLRRIALTSAGLNKEFSSLGNTISTGLGIGMGIELFRRLADAMRNVASAGIEFNSTVEQARIGFASMLKSAEAADVFLQNFWHFAERAPFDFPELLQSSRMLLAMGFAARDVLPVMKAIGDTVSAMGGGADLLRRITLAIGQIKTKGIIQSEELRQLTEAGVPAYEILQEKLDLTLEQVRDIGRRKVTADKALAALYEGIMERFGGAMENQFKTFQGKLTALRKRWSRFLGQLSSELFGWLSNVAIPKITDIIERLSKAFDEKGWRGVFEELIPPGLIDILYAVSNAIGGVVQWFKELDRNTQVQILSWGALGAAVLGGVVALGLFTSIVSTVFKAFGLVSAIMGFLTSPIFLVIAGVTLLYTAWNKNWFGIQDITENVYNVIKPIITWLWEKLNIAWDWIINIGGTLWEAIKSGDWKTFTKVISDLWGTGANIYIGLMLAKGAAGKVLSAISAAFSKFGGVKGAGVAGTIALISIGVQLMEAIGEGNFKDFAANMVAALTAGLLAAGLTGGNIQAGALTFSLALNFRLGETVREAFRSWVDELKNLAEDPGASDWKRGLSIGVLGALGAFRFQKGCILPGISGPDQFPALLAPGEAVVPSKIVQGGAAAVVKWFRQMGVPGFQRGMVPKTGSAIDASLASTSNWIRDIEDGFKNLIVDIGRGFAQLFKWLGELLVGIAELVLPKETLQQLRDFWSRLQEGINKIIDSFSKEREEGEESEEEETPSFVHATKELNKFIEALRIATENIGEAFVKKAPILSDVLKGAEEGAAAGPEGSIAGAIAALINNSETFSIILANVNPLLQSIADVIGGALEPLLPGLVVIVQTLTPVLQVLATIISSILTPVFQALFPVMKLFGLVIIKVAQVFAWAWNAVANAINWALGWLGVHIATIDTWELQQAFDTLSDLTWDNAMAMAKAADAANKVTRALRNVPEGFKYALEAFAAADPGRPTYRPPSPSPPTISPPNEERPSPGSGSKTKKEEERYASDVIIYGDVYGYDDFEKKVNQAVSRKKRSNSLTKYGTAGAC